MRLVPFSFWLDERQPTATALAPDRLAQAMADQLASLGHPGAEALRWAITAVDPARGLHLEGMAVAAATGLTGDGSAKPGIDGSSDQAP